MNEFGVVLSGPIKKDKLFFFFNYDAYRFSHGPLAAYQTLPTQAEYNGIFTDEKLKIYDPTLPFATGPVLPARVHRMPTTRFL